ncbi:MAG TPA: PilN domain-containing protein [Kofleriaceae bacterium]
MIRINLLPARKVKRAADPSSKALLFGLSGLVAVALIIILGIDGPRRAQLRQLDESNKKLATALADQSKALVGYKETSALVDMRDARLASIKRLMTAQVVPANVLHELGQILSPGGQPTMTEQMVLLTGSGPLADSNKHFQGDWDATHVWLSGFTDTGGVFKLEGGAQSESDVIQLSKRLAASVYFMEVTPSGGERVADKDTGMSYYKFTISGKVAY